LIGFCFGQLYQAQSTAPNAFNPKLPAPQQVPKMYTSVPVAVPVGQMTDNMTMAHEPSSPAPLMHKRENLMEEMGSS